LLVKTCIGPTLVQPESMAAAAAAMIRDLMRMRTTLRQNRWPDSSLVFAAIHAVISFACQAGAPYMRHVARP